MNEFRCEGFSGLKTVKFILHTSPEGGGEKNLADAFVLEVFKRKLQNRNKREKGPCVESQNTLEMANMQLSSVLRRGAIWCL